MIFFIFEFVGDLLYLGQFPKSLYIEEIIYNSDRVSSHIGIIFKISSHRESSKSKYSNLKGGGYVFIHTVAVPALVKCHMSGIAFNFFLFGGKCTHCPSRKYA